MCAGAFYFTINFKKFSKKFLQPKTRSVRGIVYYGSILSIIFTCTYIAGNILISGIKNPF